MIMNRVGAHFTYQNNTYTLGDHIVGSFGTPYAGLYGMVWEIRDGADKETGNENPDFYCKFMPPVTPEEIKALEKRFSELYHLEKKLEDITFDMVILAPGEFEVIGKKNEKRQIIVYTVTEDWAIDGDYGVSQELFADSHGAKYAMLDLVHNEMHDGIINRWLGREDLETETDGNKYSCWLYGDYCESHYTVTINSHTLYLSDSVFGTLGRSYIDESRLEDFISHISGWEEFDALPEEYFQKFIADPKIPERLHKSLSNVDGYAEYYWEILSECASDLLKEYLSRVAEDNDCFVPEPDNLYPLCMGNGSEKCNKCCVYKDMNGEGGNV